MTDSTTDMYKEKTWTDITATLRKNSHCFPTYYSDVADNAFATFTKFLQKFPHLKLPKLYYTDISGSVVLIWHSYTSFLFYLKLTDVQNILIGVKSFHNESEILVNMDDELLIHNLHSITQREKVN